MTNYEKLIEIIEDNDAFFVDMLVSGTFKIGVQTAADILHIKDKTWFEPEMIDELIELDHKGRFEHTFYPNVYNETEFHWDSTTKKFTPPVSFESRVHECDDWVDLGNVTVKFLMPDGEMSAVFKKHLCLHPHEIACPNDGSCNPKMHGHQVAIDECLPTIFTTIESVSNEYLNEFVQGKAPFTVSWEDFWKSMEEA